MSKLKPVNGNVILRPVEEQEMMSGNIIIPDMGKEKPEMGTVIATGPGRLSEYGKMIPIRSCKVGDTVLIPKIGSLRIDFEGDEYFITQDREVLGVVSIPQEKQDKEFLDL